MISAMQDIISRLGGARATQETIERGDAAVVAAISVSNEKVVGSLSRVEMLLTAINENIYKMTKEFTGAATSLDKIESIMGAQVEAQEFGKTSSESTLDGSIAPPKKSAIEELFDRINKYLSLVSAVLLPLLGGFFLRFKKWIDETFGEFWGNVTAVFGFLVAFSSRFRSAVFNAIGGVFKGIARVFAAIGPDLAAKIFDGFAKLKSKFTWIDDVVKVVGKIFGGGGELGKMFSFLPKLLKGIPVIGQVFSVVMSVVDGIKGAISGYEEGGILGAIRGALSGVISGLIGWIGDLSSWLVGSLLELLGFEELGKQMKEFDFTSTVKGFVEGLFDTLVNAIKAPFQFIGDLISSFQKLFDDVQSGEGILDSLKDFGKNIMAAIMDFFTKLVTNAIPIDAARTKVIEKLNVVRQSVGIPPMPTGGGGGEQPATPTAASVAAQPAATGTDAAGQLIQSAGLADAESFFGAEEAVEDADRIAAARRDLISARRSGDSAKIGEATKALDTAIETARENGTFEDLGFSEEKIQQLREMPSANAVVPGPARTTELTQQAASANAVVPGPARTTELTQQAAAQLNQVAAQRATAPTANIVVAPTASSTTNVQNTSQNMYNNGSAALTTDFAVSLA